MEEDEEEEPEVSEADAAAELEEEAKTPPKKTRKSKSKKVAEPAVGDDVTVKDADSSWEGIVTETEPLKVEPKEGYSGAGKSFEVDIANVTVA